MGFWLRQSEWISCIGNGLKFYAICVLAYTIHVDINVRKHILSLIFAEFDCYSIMQGVYNTCYKLLLFAFSLYEKNIAFESQK